MSNTVILDHIIHALEVASHEMNAGLLYNNMVAHSESFEKDGEMFTIHVETGFSEGKCIAVIQLIDNDTDETIESIQHTCSDLPCEGMGLIISRKVSDTLGNGKQLPAWLVASLNAGYCIASHRSNALALA